MITPQILCTQTTRKDPHPLTLSRKRILLALNHDALSSPLPNDCILAHELTERHRFQTCDLVLLLPYRHRIDRGPCFHQDHREDIHSLHLLFQDTFQRLAHAGGSGTLRVREANTEELNSLGPNLNPAHIPLPPKQTLRKLRSKPLHQPNP